MAATAFGLDRTPATPEWHNSREGYLECPLCGIVDECPQGRTVSKCRMFSFGQRKAGRAVIRNDRIDVNCCKVCDPTFKKCKYTPVEEQGLQGGHVAPGHQAFGHAAASGLAQTSSGAGVDELPKVICVFFRAEPPREEAFLLAASAMQRLLPAAFWERLHKLVTSASGECKRVEALLRRNWSQCNKSAPGLFKTLSHCGAIRVWAPSPQFPVDDFEAYDSSRVAYKDLGNEIYQRGMAMVYGRDKLECVTGQDSVGDLVEAALGFGYYMRWCVSRDKSSGYDYGVACVEHLETVMLFVYQHKFNHEYLAGLEEKLAILRRDAELAAVKAQFWSLWKSRPPPSRPMSPPPKAPPMSPPRPPNYPPPPKAPPKASFKARPPNVRAPPPWPSNAGGMHHSCT